MCRIHLQGCIYVCVCCFLVYWMEYLHISDTCFRVSKYAHTHIHVCRVHVYISCVCVSMYVHACAYIDSNVLLTCCCVYICYTDMYVRVFRGMFSRCWFTCSRAGISVRLLHSSVCYMYVQLVHLSPALIILRLIVFQFEWRGIQV